VFLHKSDHVCHENARAECHGRFGEKGNVGGAEEVAGKSLAAND